MSIRRDMCLCQPFLCRSLALLGPPQRLMEGLAEASAAAPSPVLFQHKPWINTLHLLPTFSEATECLLRAQ